MKQSWWWLDTEKTWNYFTRRIIFLSCRDMCVTQSRTFAIECSIGTWTNVCIEYDPNWELRNKGMAAGYARREKTLNFWRKEKKSSKRDTEHETGRERVACVLLFTCSELYLTCVTIFARRNEISRILQRQNQHIENKNTTKRYDCIHCGSIGLRHHHR